MIDDNVVAAHEPASPLATSLLRHREILALACLTFVCACGPPAASAEPSRSPSAEASPHTPGPRFASPPSNALDPRKAPHATSVFNLAAMRSRKRTSRLLAFFTHSLPDGIAVEDIEWLAVDGPASLDSPTKNVTFIARPSSELLVVRGRQSGFSAVATPTPPRDKELLQVRVRAPAKMIAVPYFELPASVEELTLVLESADDDGVEIHLREHCPDAGEAAKAAATLDAMLAKLNGTAGRELTRGLLQGAQATIEGNDARLDVHANAEQVDALVELAVTLIHGPS